MAYPVISSRKNEMIKNISGLVHSADLRRTQGLFVVEGARLCADAVRSNTKVKQLLFTESALKKYSSYLQNLLQTAEDAVIIAPHVAQLISATKNSQEIFAVCAMCEENHNFSKMKPNGMYLAMENIQDPANLGAVLRTAEALGISGVLLVGNCCDIYSSKALRSGMGATFRLPIFKADSFSEIQDFLKTSKFSTFAAVPNSSAKSATEISFASGSVVFIGNEGNGLLESTINACGTQITIPMRGRAESLNAASSAAILMWEMVRPSSL